MKSRKRQIEVGDIISCMNQYYAAVKATRGDGALWVDSVNPGTFEPDHFKRSEMIFEQWGVSIIRKSSANKTKEKREATAAGGGDR